jgi:hypothetical protein
MNLNKGHWEKLFPDTIIARQLFFQQWLTLIHNVCHSADAPLESVRSQRARENLSDLFLSNVIKNIHSAGIEDCQLGGSFS